MLLRGLSEQMDSMRRFGDAMQAGLSISPEVAVHAQRIESSPNAGPGLVGRMHRNIDEFVRFPAAVRAARARRPATDVFHITDSAHAHVISRLPSERTVVSCHDVRELQLRDVDPGVASLDWLLSRRLRLHLRGIQAAAAVVCSSTPARRDIATLTGVPEHRIAVIPKGVGDEFVALPSAQRERLRRELGTKGHVVLSVVSANRWKNLPMIVRAIAALRDDGLDVTLIRVGSALSTAHSDLARELLGSAIHDVGRVSDQRLIELYNACDVLLYPSLLEGFGRPPVEAMACGLPVVASAAEPFAEVLGDAALLPDPHDERAVSAATRSVLLDSGIAAGLRARGAARAARYTWAATIGAYVDVYREVRGRCL